ncbi:MAG: PQQ-binding-like beta-propeller repeat protein [Longimicrobiales bacterium]
MQAVEWLYYGGDPGGMRYSAAADINRTNVNKLILAWSLRAGDVSPEMFDPDGHRAGNLREDGTPIASQRGASCGSCHTTDMRFESTAITRDSTLYISTPRNRILAIDAGTGNIRWTFDPGIDATLRYAEDFVSRGVASWIDHEAPRGHECAERLFVATIDARLIAVNAQTGKRCLGFGDDGVINLDEGGSLEGVEVAKGQYVVTSPPAVAGGVVVVGSSIAPRVRAQVHGVVRGFDARTGALRWSFDPIQWYQPIDSQRPTSGYMKASGGGNVWSIMSFDSARDMVFLPTSGPAPSHYGGVRSGANPHANSVVALRATTGELVWSFQVVHHDLWDYDVAAQPMLVKLRLNGLDRDVVVVGTKMGMIFVLDRDSGVPVLPVEERGFS